MAPDLKWTFIGPDGSMGLSKDTVYLIYVFCDNRQQPRIALWPYDGRFPAETTIPYGSWTEFFQNWRKLSVVTPE